MPRLTRRELEALQLLAEGLSYKQIADRLGITLNTVNNHLRNVREKLDAHSSIEAIHKAHSMLRQDENGSADENSREY